jgi:hypothetical protein
MKEKFPFFPKIKNSKAQKCLSAKFYDVSLTRELLLLLGHPDAKAIDDTVTIV